MTDKKTSQPEKKYSPDWFVQGVLTKLGETFDRFTGRNWKPSSSLATSELIQRLKRLLDAEVKDKGERGRFVPHNIKLKMQWNKFSTEAEEALRKLENELLAAAIDHINDNRYHTFAPLKVTAKADYFTEGVQLWAGFDEFAPDEQEEGVIKVTMPPANLQNILIGEAATEEAELEAEIFVAEFVAGGKTRSVELKFKTGQRRSVGRTKETDLAIDDPSVSKVHASLIVNGENALVVADTGSTNGTFVNEERIAYGRAYTVADNSHVKFGTVEVFFRRVPRATDFEPSNAYETANPTTEKTIAFDSAAVLSAPSTVAGAEGARTANSSAQSNGNPEMREAQATNENFSARETLPDERGWTREDARPPKTQPRIDLDE